jgi:hypothetical protein
MRAVAVIALASAACLAACHQAAAPASSSAASAAPAAAPSAPASGPVALADLPRRKAGLWKQTMTMEGRPGMTPAMETCVDPATESRMAALGQREGQAKCSSQTFSRNLDGSITFSAVCPTGDGGTSTTKGTVTGDFGSSYKVDVDSRITGANPAANGERKVSMSATWEGPCPGGEKGGDMTMIMPDGSKMKMPAMGGMSGPPGQ